MFHQIPVQSQIWYAIKAQDSAEFLGGVMTVPVVERVSA